MLKAVPTLSLLTPDWPDFASQIVILDQPIGTPRDSLLPLIRLRFPSSLMKQGLRPR